MSLPIWVVALAVALLAPMIVHGFVVAWTRRVEARTREALARARASKDDLAVRRDHDA